MNARNELPTARRMADGRYPSLSRRGFLGTAAVGLTGAGAAALVGCGGGKPGDLDGELDVTSIRLSKPPPACVAAQYMAEQYLYEEGFREVQYVPITTIAEVPMAVSSGVLDFSMSFAAASIVAIDRGQGLSLLAGMHIGCFEVFARDGITDIREIKRMAVSQQRADAADYSFIATWFQYVGIHPARDLIFVEGTPAESAQRLADGDVDAFLAFPPLAQDLKARGIGHVIQNSIKDAPLSNYFCCLVAGNKKFIREHPAATTRVLRAYIKGAKHSASRPDEVADFLVAKSIIANPDYAREMMRALPYDVWNTYDAADTLRFYALQLREAGDIKSTPDEIIRNGTDFRFLNQLKREMAYFPPADSGRSAFALDCDIAPVPYGPALTLAAVPGNSPEEAPS